jgi:hypothetical protein
MEEKCVRQPRFFKNCRATEKKKTFSGTIMEKMTVVRLLKNCKLMRHG